MVNGIRTEDLSGFNKGHSLKFREGSRVWQTPEEGWRTYWPKRCGNNNNDEDNSLKTLNEKKEFNRFEFKVFLTKAKELSLPYYSPITRGRIIGFITFPKSIRLCEMLSASSGISTHLTVSISYKDSHYIMGTSTPFKVISMKWNTNHLIQDLNLDYWIISTIITIMLKTPPHFEGQ